jgi:hypothetical protein
LFFSTEGPKNDEDDYFIPSRIITDLAHRQNKTSKKGINHSINRRKRCGYFSIHQIKSGLLLSSAVQGTGTRCDGGKNKVGITIYNLKKMENTGSNKVSEEEEERKKKRRGAVVGC